MGEKRSSGVTANTGFIVFSGYNQRAVIALCRTLTHMRVPFHVVASSPKDTIFSSRYRVNVCETRSTARVDAEDILRCVRRIVEKAERSRYVIAPSAESLNILFLEHRSVLEDLACVIPLVPMQTYELVSHKLSFYRFCQDYSVPVPRMIESISPSSLPFVAKPVADITEDGRRVYPYVVLTEADYLSFRENADCNDYFFEEYIDGESYYLLYYLTQNGQIRRYSQRNLVQQAMGRSIVAAEPASLHLDDRFALFDEMLLDLSFHGLLMIEVRFRDHTGYMIEANPRMWGPSQLVVDAGMNLLFEMANEYCGGAGSMQSMKIEHEPVLYCWTAGIYESLTTSGYVTWHCDRDLFIRRYRHFLESDVYLRDDTMGIFERELADVLLCNNTCPRGRDGVRHCRA